MSVSTPTTAVTQHGRIRVFGLTVIAAAVIAAGVWGLVDAVGGGNNSARPSVTSQASALASLSPQNRRYVESIAALTPAQIAAAFGSGTSTNATVLASLSPHDRQYVEQIMALTPQELAAAFGTGK